MLVDEENEHTMEGVLVDQMRVQGNFFTDYTSMTSFKSVGYQKEGGVCRDVRDSLVRADGTTAEASI